MIIKLFESQVEKNPDATALIHGNQALTYRELNQRANQLAHYLQQQGVGPEISVGICMDRSLEMMVGLLGILKAGGAYIPLDPNYPEARLTFMIRDATPMFVITQAHLVEKLRSFGVPFLAIDSQWESITNQRLENLSTDVKPDHLAYIIYTSGSTGKPKGVMIEHRSLANFTEVAGTEYAIESNDRVLQFASISFDASVEEIFPCLTRGGTLVLRTDNMLGSVGKFLQFCREMALTILDLPTSFWHQMVADLVTTEVVFPTSLRLIIIGGEKAQTGPMAAWFKYAPSSIRLVNTYGPTEATVVATKYDLSGGALTQNVPIGRPLLNVETFILSDHLQPVPVGVPGELYIGGAGLARGYLHQPALTSEKFILNPFSEAAGARLYKTGDLARYLPDGNIEFLGRVDSQVKIRGFRIELGEIEFALQQHPAVKQVIALAREDTPGEKRLVAYIVPRDEELSTAQEWRQFLQSKLPDYMIPSAFVLIDKLPITKNGKIDFQALPVPELTRRD
ncbi:MAG: non-ribosomal peptide synthetase, partial [Anaerolineales bacterium]